MIIEYIYFPLFVIMFIMLIIGAYSFKENAITGGLIEYFFVIFINGISHILHQIAFTMTGESLGNIISRNKFYNQPTEIAAFIFTVLTFTAFIWFMYSFNLVSVIFKPNSLMTVLYVPKFLFIISST